MTLSPDPPSPVLDLLNNYFDDVLVFPESLYLPRFLDSMTYLFFASLLFDVPNTSLYFYTVNLVSDLGTLLGELLYKLFP